MSTLRRANHRDARSLSEIAEATFRTTFGAVNKAGHMDLHCRNNFGERIQTIEIADPGMITLLSEVEGILVGYAQLRWGKAPGCVPAKHPAEIQRLYVVEGWHGKGIAHEIMNACIDEAELRGSDAVWLGVWEHNPRAISFYRKSGFAAVGEHTFPLGGDPQRDIVMVRSIGTGRVG